jgi:hypothetical protein
MIARDRPRFKAYALFERGGEALQLDLDWSESQRARVVSFRPDRALIQIRLGGGGWGVHTKYKQSFRTADSSHVLTLIPIERPLSERVSQEFAKIALGMVSPVSLLDPGLVEVVSIDPARMIIHYHSGGLDVGPRSSSEFLESEEQEVAQAVLDSASRMATSSLAEWLRVESAETEKSLAANAERLTHRRNQIIVACSALAGGATADAGSGRREMTAAERNREREAGELLAFEVDGEFRYPAFQFKTSGKVAPVVPQLLALGTALGWPPFGGWSMMLWLFSPEAELEGRRPVDLIESEAPLLLKAFARRFVLDSSVEHGID